MITRRCTRILIKSGYNISTSVQIEQLEAEALEAASAAAATAAAAAAAATT